MDSKDSLEKKFIKKNQIVSKSELMFAKPCKIIN